MTALGAELLAALASPEGRDLLDAVFRPIAREEARAALAERDEDRFLDSIGLADLLAAPSAAALRMRLARDPELARLAVGGSGRARRWRRTEVLALVQQRGKRRP